MFNSPKPKGSARSQIGIEEVRGNVLVLPGNHYRMILQTSSVNFELKSEDEQDALIDGFQSFLNSLTLPVQVVVRIRELDIDRYLEGFEAARSEEATPIYRDQLAHYGSFIRSLVSGNKILSRMFYVIVPLESKANSEFSVLQSQLNLEVEIITKGLEKLGMSVRIVPGLEVLNLFYSFYQPEAAKTQPLVQALLTQRYADFI